MELKLLESSNLQGYRYEHGDLFIKFKSGGTYVYKNVNSDIVEKFECSESKGKFFFSEIKNAYEWEKIDAS